MTDVARLRRRLLPWILAVVWIASFVATHIPAEKIPNLNTSDKVMHMIGYGVLAGVFWLTLVSHGWPTRRRAMVVLGVLLAYGALDESTQPLVNRYASVDDWLFDGLGAILAVVAMEAAARLRPPRTTA